MAGETLVSEHAKNKRAFVMSDDPRVVHLEGRVERVEKDVSDIKAGVQKLLERPQFAGFQQVVGTLLTTFMVVGLIFGLNEWRLSVAATPVAKALEKIEAEAQRRSDAQHMAEIKAAVMAERLEWMRELKARQP